MRRYLRDPRVLWGAAAACAIGGAWWGYERVYAGPARELESQAEAARKDIERRSAEVNTLPAVTRQIRELTAGQLGQTEERVEANLRTALNDIGAKAGLGSVVVTTSEAARVRNPAALVASEWGSGSAGSGGGRTRREQIDFRTMGASLKGTGTLAQALRVLAIVQHQPWANRVDGFVINPIGEAKDRSRVDFTLRLTTVFAPDVPVAGPTASDALWKEPPPEVIAAFQPVISKNVFREPPPKPAVAQKPPAPPPPAGPSGPPPVPYGEWRVVALVRGVAGPELWLSNEKTQQRLTLAPGQQVLDATFVGASGEEARLRIGEQEFVVALAQTLEERRAVSR